MKNVLYFLSFLLFFMIGEIESSGQTYQAKVDSNYVIALSFYKNNYTVDLIDIDKDEMVGRLSCGTFSRLRKKVCLKDVFMDATIYAIEKNENIIIEGGLSCFKNLTFKYVDINDSYYYISERDLKIFIEYLKEYKVSKNIIYETAPKDTMAYNFFRGFGIMYEKDDYFLFFYRNERYGLKNEYSLFYKDLLLSHGEYLITDTREYLFFNENSSFNFRALEIVNSKKVFPNFMPGIKNLNLYTFKHHLDEPFTLKKARTMIEKQLLLNN